MRPAYFQPKLTDADRSKIRRLRKKDPEKWSFSALAERFHVDKSTVCRAAKPPRAGKRRKAKAAAAQAADAQTATGTLAPQAVASPKAEKRERARANYVAGLERAIDAKQLRKRRARLLELLRGRE
jgi:hypothetical protein